MSKAAILHATFATLNLGDSRSREIALQLVEVHRETLLAPEVDQGNVAHDACCMWEWILEQRSKPEGLNPCLDRLFDEHGSCAIRYALHELVPLLEEEWNALGDERYKRVFDWEFVPSWCEKHLARELSKRL